MAGSVSTLVARLAGSKKFRAMAVLKLSGLGPMSRIVFCVHTSHYEIASLEAFSSRACRQSSGARIASLQLASNLNLPHTCLTSRDHVSPQRFASDSAPQKFRRDTVRLPSAPWAHESQRQIVTRIAASNCPRLGTFKTNSLLPTRRSGGRETGLCFARYVFLTFRGPLASHDSNPYPNRSRIARYNATSPPQFWLPEKSDLGTSLIIKRKALSSLMQEGNSPKIRSPMQ